MDNGVEGKVMTEALEDEVVSETPKIDTTIKIEGEVKVKAEGILRIIEEEVKITFHRVDAGHGMVTIRVIVTEIIGIETMIATIMAVEVGDGITTEGKVIVIEDGEGNGTQIPSIHNKNTHKIMRHKIITSPHLWDVNINIKCRMSNTCPTHNCHNNIHRDLPHNHGKLPIYVSYVRIKAIMIINANLQAILWPEHKKPLIKATHTIIKIQVKGNGQTGITTMTTRMANLFSSGGSQCR